VGTANQKVSFANSYTDSYCKTLASLTLIRYFALFVIFANTSPLLC